MRAIGAGCVVDPGLLVDELDVDIAAMERTDSGLYYQIVRPGSGATIEPGQTAVVNYTGDSPAASDKSAG